MSGSHMDPNLVPTIPAPPGHHSQLINPPRQTLPTILFFAFAVVFSTPFVALRMYTRQHITRKLWWDDWTCLLGWMFYVILGGLMIKGLNYGMGTDLWNVSKARHKKFTKLFHDVEIIARIGMAFTKTSIILLYQRLFVPRGTRWTGLWWSIWFAFWWNLLYAIALVLAVAFQCVGKDALVAQGKQCLDEYAVLISASVINVTTDVMILIIPLAAIWGLQVPTEKKWRLSTVFAIGMLGLLASIARLAYQIPMADKPNKTKIINILLLLNAAEQFIGIIVCCMPILPAFYRHIKAQRTQLDYEGPSSLGNKITNTFLAQNSGNSKGSKGQPKDPYPLYSTRGYEELNELEAQGQRKCLGGIVRGTEVSVIVEVRGSGSRERMGSPHPT